MSVDARHVVPVALILVAFVGGLALGQRSGGDEAVSPVVRTPAPTSGLPDVPAPAPPLASGGVVTSALDGEERDEEELSPAVVEGLRETLARAEAEAVRLRAKVERQEQDLRERALALASARSDLALLEQRLSDLTRPAQVDWEQAALADGVVLSVEPGQVWIDAGARQGLRRGTRFQLFDEVAGATRVKAIVEAREVQPERARCAVLEGAAVQDPTTGARVALPLPDAPPAVGDRVRNPFFARDATQDVVVLGHTATRLPLATLLQALHASGARVTDRVDIGTDVVVVLDDAEAVCPEEVERGLRFGVPTLSEDDLLERLGLGAPQER